LPHGIPSHDTFNRFFSALDPDEFEQAFLSWIKDVSKLTEGDVISIDGKTVCGSRDRDSKRAVHIVSTWSKAYQLSLGQVKVDEKSNEITAIPKLLNVLAINGCLVTIDAMGCQRDIAAGIIEKGADYLLAVKGNQGSLQEDAERTVRFTKLVSEWIEDDFGYGRIEQRKCTLYNDLLIYKQCCGMEKPECNSKDRSHTLHQIKWKRRKRDAALHYFFQTDCRGNWQRSSFALRS
jgi:predicted transposase YbfD/YdcC